MDEKTKLYVFAKKEVALIFIFMILIALTSFFFGVKVGKSFSYEAGGFIPEDRQKVDLLSGQEEKVNDVVKEVNKDDQREVIKPKDSNQLLEERLKQELAGEEKKINTLRANTVEMEENTEPGGTVEPAPGVVVPPIQPSTKPAPALTKKDQYSGKYTVQLGAYRSLQEAEEFAQGFKVRGYNPIISEADIPNRGTWFRVSLGVFNTITDAKEYVKAENSLFQGQDIVFRRFD